MQVGACRVSGASHPTNPLPCFDPGPRFGEEGAQVTINGDIALTLIDDDVISQNSIKGRGNDDSVLGGEHRGSVVIGDIEPRVVRPGSCKRVVSPAKKR